MVNFEHYKIFYYIAKNNSFSAGARELFLTQSTVTRAIQALEGQLGYRLFDRTNHGVKLTASGNDLYKEISPAIEILANAENSLLNHSEQTILVGANASTLHSYVIPCAETFRKKYPNIDIRIKDINLAEAQELLKLGKLDVAIPGALISKASDIKLVDDIGYIPLVTPVEFTEDVALVGKKYSHLANKPITLEELSTYPLIIMHEDSYMRGYYEMLFKKHNLTLTPAIEVKSPVNQVEMVKQGLGYCFYTKHSVQKEIDEKLLFPLQLSVPVATGYAPLLTSKSKKQRKIVNLFIEHIVAYAESLAL